jgi:hypothetical protein
VKSTANRRLSEVSQAIATRAGNSSQSYLEFKRVSKSFGSNLVIDNLSTVAAVNFVEL